MIFPFVQSAVQLCGSGSDAIIMAYSAGAFSINCMIFIKMFLLTDKKI